MFVIRPLNVSKKSLLFDLPNDHNFLWCLPNLLNNTLITGAIKKIVSFLPFSGIKRKKTPIQHKGDVVMRMNAWNT